MVNIFSFLWHFKSNTNPRLALSLHDQCKPFQGMYILLMSFPCIYIIIKCLFYIHRNAKKKNTFWNVFGNLRQFIFLGWTRKGESGHTNRSNKMMSAGMLEPPSNQPPWAHRESERQEEGGPKLHLQLPIGFYGYQSGLHAFQLAAHALIYRAISSSCCCVIAGNFLTIALRRTI